MSGPLADALEIIGLLEDAAVAYVLGGSLASSTFGEPRATNDIDLAVELDEAGLSRLAPILESAGFYVPTDAAARAVAERGSFNVIPPSALKVDLFVLGNGLLDRRQMERRVSVPVAADPPRTIHVTSPLDQILRKLSWYRNGGEVSERQWRDIIGLLRLQHSSIDLTQLSADAEAVGLLPLLERALSAVDAD